MDKKISDFETRNSNIELLRLVLMLMVILLHFNSDTQGQAFLITSILPKTNFLLHFFESLIICAVNCFMIVSGFFLLGNKKIKIAKIVDIVIIVIFYQYLDYFARVLIFKEIFSFKHLLKIWLPVNYFAIFYCISYLFSPFLSKLYEHMDIKISSCFTILLVVIFVLYPTLLDFITDLTGKIINNISSISTSGNGRGYTIIQFFVDLSIGMYIRKLNLKPKAIILLIIFLVTSLILSLLAKSFPSLYNYSSIFVVINAICLFYIFLKINIQSSLINYFSKSVFAIYCIHTRPVAINIWRDYFIKKCIIQDTVIRNLLWIVIGVIIMFIASLLISIVMRFLLGKLKSNICMKCPIINLF